MKSFGAPHRYPEDYNKTEFLGGKNLFNFPRVKKAGANAKTERLVSVNQRYPILWKPKYHKCAFLVFEWINQVSGLVYTFSEVQLGYLASPRLGAGGHF